MVYAHHERNLAVHFVAFLQRLVAYYPTERPYLVLDQAPAQTAKVVQTWLKAYPHMTLLWLPKYAAHETNSAERIWGLIKSAVAADRLAGTIEELVAAPLIILFSLAFITLPLWLDSMHTAK